ncbi:YraN family protein [Brevibacillus choshinensis]|uniref:YraN family protein n=1 Tax=Brevibacillus choshinensis TaxID=54911 RepID=UPI002E2264EF|nr:YraN family protein [Brevibacillus choshinensis]MED4750092.1 YraN family protein [Brevibacillus choshinensis]
MSERRRALGQKGEEMAETFLNQNGYEILGRNIRTRRGEIDLIARDGDTLVFVEVRTRTSQAYGSAAESVTWRKRQKLRELAMDYLQNSLTFIPAFRFDVVAIHCPVRSEAREEITIEHFKHAF